MRIKRLDICGFKSFMDRSVFSFHDGITGVVGPNGCGKSNVVDAIRWVMGEQSAKNLRGRGMEDVIFNGSETQAPLSMAEVTLTLAIDADEVMPPQFQGLAEVAVTRRLFRNGESEYELNRTRCRLLDITELFLGTGVGTRAYSIIEQGRVGQIVSSRPEDRRTFIEEAAGVTRYKARKKAAERKMEHAANNLLRINDVVAELKGRKDSLERQAKKAEKYRNLKAEMRKIELHISSHRYLELLSLRKVVEGRLAQFSERERDGLAAVQEQESTIEKARQAWEQEQAELQRLSAEVQSLEGQAKLDASNLEHWNRDLAQTRERISALETELSELSHAITVANDEEFSHRVESESLQSAGQEHQVHSESLANELQRVQELMRQVGERLERDRADSLDAARKVANVEASMAGLMRRRSDADSSAARLDGELTALDIERTALEQGRADVLERVGQSQKNHAELQQRRTEEETALSRTREAFAENEIQVICLREELADKRSRLHSLQEIARNYEGYDRGVRAVMQQVGDGDEKLGVVGLLSDLLKAPAPLEKAIEAMLAERMQHVVVAHPQAAWEWVERLSSRGDGRATFVPLAAVDSVAVADAPATNSIPVVAEPIGPESAATETVSTEVVVNESMTADAGATEALVAEVVADGSTAIASMAAESVATESSMSSEVPATDVAPVGEAPISDELLSLPVAALAVVRPARPEAKPLLSALLEGVVFVEDLAQAKALSTEASDKTYVTRNGEVIRPGGVTSGGVLEGPGVGALEQRRQIDALQGEVATVESRYNEIVTRHYELQKQMGHSEGVLKGLSRHAHAEEVSLAGHEKELSAQATALAKLEERVAQVRQELDRAKGMIATINLEEHALKGELLHADADRSARDERVRLLMSEMEELERRAKDTLEAQTQLKVKMASEFERVEATGRAAEQARQRAVELKARTERNQIALEESRLHLQQLEGQIATVAEGVSQREIHLQEQQTAYGERREAAAQAAHHIKEQETELKALRARLDEATQGLSQLGLQDRESAIELQHLVAQTMERWSVPMAHAVSEFHLVKSLDESGKAQLKELKQQVERMGEVNVAAIDELHEVSERYDFLQKQRADLENSIDQLKSAIKKIDATSRERFQQTFDAVNDRFTQIFPRLFGGGRAQLVLTEEAPGMEAGVEIVAQPPGKKLQSVQLLSGGEKALTAVSMIFSIFLIKPTPFCLLDEVDAPLDEANVGRYNDMVKEMSKQSQFILITHNKRTMEIVDNLYGVTMEEPGISKLVTVKLLEAGAANENLVA